MQKILTKYKIGRKSDETMERGPGKVLISILADIPTQLDTAQDYLL